jgi:hypothetical protein
VEYEDDERWPPRSADWDEVTIGIATALVMRRSDVDEYEARRLLLAACDRTRQTLTAVARSYVETGHVSPA